MSRISRTRGKNFELRIARYMSAKRNYFEAEDLAHPILSIECKYRQQLPKQLVKHMAQSEAAAEDGKVPVVVMGERYQDTGKSLVVMRLEDLRGIVG